MDIKEYLKRVLVVILSITVPLVMYGLYWKSTIGVYDLLFTSDIHGYVIPKAALDENGKVIKKGGAGSLVTYLKSVKNEYLLYDGGDMFYGAPEGVLSGGILPIEVMNRIGYTASVVGNHEFDFGVERLREISKTASFPFIMANIKEKDTGVLPAFMKDSVVNTLKDIKIGVTGLITTVVPQITRKENVENLEFTEPVETFTEIIKNMDKQNVHLKLLLSHMGYADDIEFAGKVKGLDIIFGGHSHTTTHEAKKIGRTLICHPGSKLDNVGHLKLYYSIKENRLITYTYKTVKLDNDRYPEDEEITVFIEGEISKIKEDLYRVIGQASKNILGFSERQYKKHKERVLGNWQTDLMRKATKSDFAFQNSGGIRGSIFKGDITLRDIYKISPFGNTLVTMTLKGNQIYELLEQSVSNDYSNLQISGIKIVFNDSLPKGRRLLNVVTLDEDGSKMELDKEKEYKIVTNSFLSAGGDGYTVFKEGEDIIDTEIVLRDLQVKTIEENSPITAEYEKRLLNVSLQK